MTGSEESSPAPSRRARPIAVYLFVLALVALVPAFLFSAILLQRNNEAQVEIVQTLTQATTRAVLQSVDREIQGMVSTLRALGSSPITTEDDLRQVYNRALGVLSGTGSTLVLINDRFDQLVNTRFPFGTELPRVRDTANVALVLKSGEPLIGNVVYSPTSERYLVPVLVPHKSDDGSALVVALTQDALSFSPVLLSQELPKGWHVALVDARNQLIAAPDQDAAAVGKPFFIPAQQQPPQLDRKWSYRDVGDQQLATLTWTSGISGWSIVAWAPRNLVERPFSDAVWSLLFGGLALAGLVAAIVWWITNRIANSVQGLAADAHRLGDGEAVPRRAYPIAEIATVADAIADAARQRRAAETEVKFLMRELAHRSKNQMTVIAAMAKQTAKSADSVPEFVGDFERRIFGLARSTDLLLANGASGVDLRELWSRQIDPFCPLDSGRVTLTGAPVRLNNQSAQILGMAAHELATNAVKYGAFSREDGTLEVNWTRQQERLHVAWREHVRALSKRAERRGFGTVVLENMVGAALGAEVARTIHADGIEWTFDIPVANLDPALMPNHPGAAAAAPAPPSAA